MDTPQPTQVPYTPPVTQPPPTPQTPVTPAASHAGLLIGILAAVVVLAAASYYFLVMKPGEVAVVSPSPSLSATPAPTTTANPTIGWKTYTSTQYGFEVKYPSNLTATERTTVSGADVRPEYTRYSINLGSNTGIVVYENVRKLTLNDWFQRNYGTIASQVSQTSIGPDNIVATRATISEMTKSDAVFLVSGNYVVHLYSTPTDPGFNQILSTFKFTR